METLLGFDFFSLDFLGLDFIAFWIIATGILVAVPSALLGSFLLLRGASLFGDALSHAVLPGLALAFLLSGSRHPLPMIIGALLAGLFTTWFTESLRTLTRIPEDVALGVTFTTLFSLGVLLISQSASQVDLDPGCVLYGVLEIVPLDTYQLGPWEIPRVPLHLAFVNLIVLAFLALCWKELKLASFDPALANTLGFPARRITYLLMSLVALVTVMSFEAVGSILVIAMLIVPAAAANLLTDRLGTMLTLAALFGAASAILGRYLGAYYETTAAGSIALTTGAFLTVALLLSPRFGPLRRALQRTSQG